MNYLAKSKDEAAQSGGHNPYRAALRQCRPVLLGVLVLSALINLLALTGSVYMLQVYDRVLSSRSVETLIGLFVIVVVLYAFFTLFTALRARLLSRTAFRLDHDMAEAAFTAGIASHRQTVADQGAAQALGDLSSMRRFLSSSGLVALIDLPFTPIFIGVLFLIHPWLGFLTIAGALIAALLALVNRAVTIGPTAKSRTLEQADKNFAEHSQKSAQALLAMGMTKAISERWVGLHRKALAASQKGSDPSDILASSSRGFRMLLQSAILTLGAFLVLRDAITPGMIIAASILAGRALAPVDQLIGQWHAIGRGLAAHRRLAAFFEDTPAEIEAIDLPEPTGEITVHKLTKLGPDRDGVDPRRILSEVSFTLEPGDGLGIVGNSAAGKSTLAQLLVGAAAADGGEIRLDGATLDQWAPDRLGRAIGYLPQQLDMLPGTIRDNICRFDPLATDDAIMEAARLTGIHDMILTLPQGYATRIGDPGTAALLSGGQMQRLGLARAIFGLPKLVVLDEPNSNLDVAGDAALTRTVAALREAGSTVIVMAHRASALESVNKLMVLDSGKVGIFGDKDEVLADPKKDQKPKTSVVPMGKPDLDETPRGRRNTPSVVRKAGPNPERRTA